MESSPTQLELTALLNEVPDSSMEAKAAKKERARAFAKLRQEEKAAERRRQERLLDAYIQMGMTYYVHGEYENSISPFLNALELDPSQIYLREFLVKAYVYLDDYEPAKDIIIDALRANPYEIWAYVGLAVCYMEGDSNSERAEQFLNRALEIDPDHAQAFNHLGSLFIEAERFDEALAQFNQTLLRHPDNAYAHYGRIMAHLGLYSLSEAETALELFTQQITPDNSEAAKLLENAQAALLHQQDRDY